jgi:hypothetical protein
VAPVALLSLVIFACDRGVYYQPKDWPKGEHPWFYKSFEQLDMKITDLGGLVGKDHLIPEIMIRNRTNSPVVLERVTLKAGGAEYLARPFGEQSWEAVPPDDTRRLALYFDVGKSIHEILNDPVEVVLLLNMGDSQKEIPIPMVRLTMGK